MIIEVTGTSIGNKGAELMLVAIREHLQSIRPDIELAVDFSFGSYADRARYRLLQKVTISRLGRSRLALSLMPQSFSRAVGIVRDHDVDVVLDASGFAFGDQHPLDRTLRFAEQAEKWASQGKALILLPQALGPFEKPGYAEAFARIVAAAGLVYARDRASFDHAVEAAGRSANIRLAPDFTNLVKTELNAQASKNKRVCIVPNRRMLEEPESHEERAAYLQLLGSCIQLTEEADLKPTLVLHGDEDQELTTQLSQSLNGNIQVEEIADPMELKRFIGESHVVISSRFHALVSALSQGVPALATSWSHKYQMLLDDYGVGEFVVPVDIGKAALCEKLQRIAGTGRDELGRLLKGRAAEQEQKVKAMWDEINTVLGLTHCEG